MRGDAARSTHTNKGDIKMSLEKVKATKRKPSQASILRTKKHARIVELMREDVSYDDMSKRLKSEGYRGTSPSTLRKIGPMLAKGAGIKITAGRKVDPESMRSKKRTMVKLEDVWNDVHYLRKLGTLKHVGIGGKDDREIFWAYTKGLDATWKDLTHKASDWREYKRLEEAGYDKSVNINEARMLAATKIKTAGLSDDEIHKIAKPIWNKSVKDGIKEEQIHQDNLVKFSTVSLAKLEELKRHPKEVKIMKRNKWHENKLRKLEKAGKLDEFVAAVDKQRVITEEINAIQLEMKKVAKQRSDIHKSRKISPVTKEMDAKLNKLTKRSKELRDGNYQGLIKQETAAGLRISEILRSAEVKKVSIKKRKPSKSQWLKYTHLVQLKSEGKIDTKLTDDYVLDNFSRYHKKSLRDLGASAAILPEGKYWVVSFFRDTKKDTHGNRYSTAVLVRVDEKNRPIKVYALEPHKYLREAFDRYVRIKNMDVPVLVYNRKTRQHEMVGEMTTAGYKWEKGDKKNYISLTYEIDEEGQRYIYKDIEPSR